MAHAETRNFSSRVEKYFTSERNYYINTNEIPNHFTFNYQCFDVKSTIHYVATANEGNMLFSHNYEDIKFSYKSSPGISLVFI